MAVPSSILDSLRFISSAILKPVLVLGKNTSEMIVINIFCLKPDNRRFHRPCHYFDAVD